jgi:hypothetical protein
MTKQERREAALARGRRKRLNQVLQDVIVTRQQPKGTVIQQERRKAAIAKANRRRFNKALDAILAARQSPLYRTTPRCEHCNRTFSSWWSMRDHCNSTSHFAQLNLYSLQREQARQQRESLVREHAAQRHLERHKHLSSGWGKGSRGFQAKAAHLEPYEGIRRCRFCRKPAMGGSDLCYTCESD